MNTTSVPCSGKAKLTLNIIADLRGIGVASLMDEAAEALYSSLRARLNGPARTPYKHRAPRTAKKKAPRRKPRARDRECPRCKGMFTGQGMAQHKKAKVPCKAKSRKKVRA